MQSDLGVFAEAVAGVSGAVVAATAVYPLDVVKTRLIVESLNGKPNQGILSCLISIARQEGTTGLYRGLDLELFKTFISNFCFTYSYTVRLFNYI
jgi:hypothetical protein